MDVSSSFGRSVVAGQGPHRRNIDTIKFEEVLFCGAYFLLTFNNLFSGVNLGSDILATWDQLGNALGLLAIGMLLLKLCFQRYTLRSMVFTMAFVLLGAIIRFRTGDSTFFFLCLLGVSSEGIDIRRLTKCLLVSCLSVVFLSLICLVLGLTSDHTIVDPRALLGVRFSLGFAHPNVLGKMLVTIGSCCALSNYDRRDFRAFWILVFLDAIALLIADSRTAVLFLTICALGCLLGDDSGALRKVNWAAFARWIYLFLLFATLGLMFVSRSSFGQISWLNQMMSYRPQFWSSYFRFYGIQPLGSKLLTGAVLNIYGSDAQLDGAFACELIQWGWLATVVVSMLVIMYTKRIEKMQAVRIGVVLLAFFIVGFTENYALSPMYNVILVGAGSLVNPSSVDVFLGRRHR
jgi:hypothetical protein